MSAVAMDSLEPQLGVLKVQESAKLKAVVLLAFCLVMQRVIKMESGSESEMAESRVSL